LIFLKRVRVSLPIGNKNDSESTATTPAFGINE